MNFFKISLIISLFIAYNAQAFRISNLDNISHQIEIKDGKNIIIKEGDMIWLNIPYAYIKLAGNDKFNSAKDDDLFVIWKGGNLLLQQRRKRILKH